MMHVDPTGHEPSHVLPVSELIPKLREALAYMSRAIRDYIRGQSRELGPAAQNSLDFCVEHSMCQARDLLLRSRGRTSADIQLHPFALQGLQDAARLFRLDMEANDFWVEFGGTALATEETISEVERILSDLATWDGDQQADKPHLTSREPGSPGQAKEAIPHASHDEARQAHAIQEYLQEWADSCETVNRELAADQLPKPEEMTLGLLRRFVMEIDKLHRDAGASPGFCDGNYTPAQRDALHRRSTLISQTPGIKALRKYLNVEFGDHVTADALKALSHRLCRKLDKSFEEIDDLKVEEALSVLRDEAREAAGTGKVSTSPEALKPGSPSPDDPRELAAILDKVRTNIRAGEAIGWGLIENGTLRRYELEQRYAELEAKMRELIAKPLATAPTPQQSKPRPDLENRQAESHAIDFDSLAETLLRSNQVLPSKLVRYMKDRSTATFQEVMDQVHGGDRTDEAIRSLVNRTNNLLHDQKSRLSFSTKDCQIIRHIASE